MSGVRGQDQRAVCSNKPLHAVRAGNIVRYLCMLRKACKEDGLLGQGILKFNQKTGAACNEKGMQRLFQRCHRAEKYGIMSTEEIQSGDRV